MGIAMPDFVNEYNYPGQLAKDEEWYWKEMEEEDEE